MDSLLIGALSIACVWMLARILILQDRLAAVTKSQGKTVEELRQELEIEIKSELTDKWYRQFTTSFDRQRLKNINRLEILQAEGKRWKSIIKEGKILMQRMESIREHPTGREKGFSLGFERSTSRRRKS